MDDPALDALREGMERLIRGYEPYPALVVDATYQVLAANRGILMLMDGVPEHLLEPPLNAMRLTLHPEGLAPRIRNLREWRGHLLEQMERQIALHRSEPLRALYEEVAAYPVPDTAPGEEPAEPVPYFALPMQIEHEGRTLSFISSISTFNTPMDVTVAELAIETLLPADPATVKVPSRCCPDAAPGPRRRRSPVPRASDRTRFAAPRSAEVAQARGEVDSGAVHQGVGDRLHRAGAPRVQLGVRDHLVEGAHRGTAVHQVVHPGTLVTAHGEAEPAYGVAAEHSRQLLLGCAAPPRRARSLAAQVPVEDLAPGLVVQLGERGRAGATARTAGTPGPGRTDPA